MTHYRKVCITSKRSLLILFLLVKTNTGNLSFQNNTCNSGIKPFIYDLVKRFGTDKLVKVVLPDANSICSCDCFNTIDHELFKHVQLVVNHQNPSEPLNQLSEALPDLYLIFVNHYSGLDQLDDIVSEQILYSKSWNPEAKFLFVTATSDIDIKNAKSQIATDIFNYLWKKNIFRVALIMVEDEWDMVGSIFSSSPYHKQSQTCKEIISFSQLQEVYLNDISISSASVIGYKFEPPHSFSGCPLKAKTFPLPPYSVAEDTSSSSSNPVFKLGIEVELVKLLAEEYNFTLTISSSSAYKSYNGWNHRLLNGSQIGLFNDIVNYEVDLVFAGGLPPVHHYFKFSLTNSYIDNSMSWYVPDAEIIPNWKIVLSSFTAFTWMFLTLMFFSVTCFYLIMLGMKASEGKQFVDLTMVALTLGISTTWTKIPYLRFVLLAWSFFSLQLAIMFNSRLFSVLTNRPVYKGVSTLTDLHSSEFGVCLDSLYKGLFNDSTDSLTRDLIEKAEICDSLENTVEDLLEYRNFTFFVKDDLMSFLVNARRANIHKLKRKFLSYNVVTIVSKGNVFLKHLNKLIYNVTESGLVLKWLNDVRRNVKTKFFSREVHKHGRNSVLLNFKDFAWFFLVFLCSQIIAVIVFSIEVCMAKFKQFFPK